MLCYHMQDVDFSSAIQSAWLGWEHGCEIELDWIDPCHHLGADHTVRHCAHSHGLTLRSKSAIVRYI